MIGARAVLKNARIPRAVFGTGRRKGFTGTGYGVADGENESTVRMLSKGRILSRERLILDRAYVF